MSPSPIPLAIPITLIVLSVASAIPLSENNLEELQPSPFVKPLEPNTKLHGVPDDYFSPQPTDLPLDFNTSNNFGLWRSGSTKPVQTVSLYRNGASFQATFTLFLPEGENIKGTRHSQNDTSIITSFEQSRERLLNDSQAFNISITHYFRGTVGIAEYELTVFTTMGATMSVTGVYYVAGVIFYASTDSEPLRIISGDAAKPLSVESIFSFSRSIRHGRVMLPIKYQDAGSDVIATKTSLEEILSTSQITVTSTSSHNIPVLINNNLKCNMMYTKVSIRQKRDKYAEECDINFDISSMSLALRLHPERNGSVIINISFPAVRTEMEKPFETIIRLEVLKPAIRRPGPILEQGVNLDLDYFGTESFSIQMKNSLSRGHRRGVLTYVIDLPNGRYAVSDFPHSSVFEGFQNISFIVVSPGQENKMLQNRIHHALMGLRDFKSEGMQREDPFVDIRVLERLTNESVVVRDRHTNAENTVTPFDLSAFSWYDDDCSGNFDIISSTRVQERSYRYRSHIHAVVLGFDALVTARSYSNSALFARFSAKQLAVVDSLQVKTNRQNLLVKIIVLGYTSLTFSQHKTTQIAMFLSKEVSTICGSSTPKASLAVLQDKGLNIEATYHVLVPRKCEDIEMMLDNYKTRTVTRIGKQALLREGRLNITDIHKLAVLGKTIGRNVTMSEPPSRYKGINGALLAIIVVSSVVIVIPVLLICAGYFTARRYREGESDLGNNPSGKSSGERKEHELTGNAEVGADVLRDDYGRAGEEANESFKVKTEMIKQGYFGDMPISKQQGSGSQAKP